MDAKTFFQKVALMRKHQKDIDMIKRDLYIGSIFAQGAKAMLRTLTTGNYKVDFGCYNINKKTCKPIMSSGRIYDNAITNFLLQSNENIDRFLDGDEMEFYEHQHDRKGIFINVKVRFKQNNNNKITEQ